MKSTFNNIAILALLMGVLIGLGLYVEDLKVRYIRTEVKEETYPMYYKFKQYKLRVDAPVNGVRKVTVVK